MAKPPYGMERGLLRVYLKHGGRVRVIQGREVAGKGII